MNEWFRGLLDFVVKTTEMPRLEELLATALATSRFAFLN